MLINDQIMQIKEAAEAAEAAAAASQNEPMDDYPAFENAIADPAELPPLKPELIEGLLRSSSKMIVQGQSKANKSFLLIELAWAIASGGSWLGRSCAPGKVLYINLEIDGAEMHRRTHNVMSGLGVDTEAANMLDIANFRGKVVGLKKLLEIITTRCEKGTYSAIIIDPAYKVQNGDENAADAIGQFCHQVDEIVEATGAAVIYCHHYSKGAKGGTAVLDRSSGSGVFARDADAIVDIIQLEENDAISEARKNLKYPHDATAWRASFVVRSFAPQEPVDMWFKYPVHSVDNLGLLDGCKAVGAPNGNGSTRTKNIEKITAACEELIAGKDEFPRIQLEHETHLSISTIKRCLQYIDGFEAYQKAGNCSMVRRSPATRSLNR